MEKRTKMSSILAKTADNDIAKLYVESMLPSRRDTNAAEEMHQKAKKASIQIIPASIMLYSICTCCMCSLCCHLCQRREAAAHSMDCMDCVECMDVADCMDCMDCVDSMDCKRTHTHTHFYSKNLSAAHSSNHTQTLLYIIDCMDCVGCMDRVACMDCMDCVDCMDCIHQNFYSKYCIATSASKQSQTRLYIMHCIDGSSTMDKRTKLSNILDKTKDTDLEKLHVESVCTISRDTNVAE